MLLDQLIASVGPSEILKSLHHELGTLADRAQSGELAEGPLARELGKFSRDMHRVALALDARYGVVRAPRRPQPNGKVS